MFCYYILVMLSNFSSRLAFLATRDQVADDIEKFIVCSIGGAREECGIHKEEAIKTLNTVLALCSVAIILYSMINFSYLLYMVWFQTVKNAMKNIFKQ